MRTSRRLELISGLASGIIGLLIVGYMLFGPFYHTETGRCTTSSAGTTCASTSGSASLLQVGIDPITILYLSILSLALLGVAVTTLLHSRLGTGVWQWCVWITTILLVITAIAGFSLAIFMLPSVLLALVAAVASTRNARGAAA